MTTKAVLYDWAGGNLWLFHAINAQAPTWLDRMMWLASCVGDYRIFPLVLGAWLLTIWQWQRKGGAKDALRGMLQAQRFALGAMVALLLAGGIKLAFDFPRPIAVLGSGLVRVLGDPDVHYSLPSGHSTFIMLLGASLWPLSAWPVRLGLIALVIWVGISRVWLGAHFPVDVLAGYAIGLFSAFTATIVVRVRTSQVAVATELPTQGPR